MKIGQFAKENFMTADAIRHYMALDLIVPIKVKGQYDFDEQCQQDLEDVRKLKAMGFLLSEIQSLMLVKRIAKYTEYERDPFYKDFFEKRLLWIEQERRRLKQMRKAIELYLEAVPPVLNGHSEGVPLSAMSLLICPRCHEPLTVERGMMTHNAITSGMLSCNCGVTFEIKEGIICEKGMLKSEPKYSEEQLSAHLMHYLQETDYSYLSRIIHTFEWLSKEVALDFGVALELGTGSGFFLRYFLERFPKKGIYIAVDHDYERLRELKNVLDGVEHKPQMLYLCCDFERIPIIDRSVDLLIDYSGSSNYGFDHDTFLLSSAKALLVPDGKWIGTYILFKNFVYGSRIPENLQHQFTERTILEALHDNGFEITREMHTEPVHKGGRFEDYFLKGEAVYSMTCQGIWHER